MPVQSRIVSSSRLKAVQNQFAGFRKSENGSMTVLTCVLIITMIILCGIAVDLMRNELERTRVQNTLDRAILAASDLDQPRPADEVINDYFAKAGMTEFLDTVSITPGANQPTTNFRIVTAQARAITPSPYMRWTGVSNLPVYAFGTAEEVIENTEISLVIDISGSMRNSGKIGNLRTAAKEFIAAVLQGRAATTTSLTIVPYAGQVNPGPIVFDRAGGVRFASTYIDADGDPQLYGYTVEGPDGIEVPVPYADISSCLELQDADFDTIAMPEGPFGSYDQVAYFMNWPIDWPTMDWGWCPQNDSAIQYAQNNIGQLQQFIDDIRLHDGTGTHYGMKYAVAALNPSTNETFKALANAGLVPDEFRDRPAPFGDKDTRKVIVLMTDGQITDQYRPEVTVDPRNATDVLNRRTDDRTTPTRRSTNLARFYSMCDKAKDQKVQIYTIAFEAPSNAVTEMRNCATAPAFFYDVDGVEISSAFQSIARQINQLRLTQ